MAGTFSHQQRTGSTTGRASFHLQMGIDPGLEVILTGMLVMLAFLLTPLQFAQAQSPAKIAVSPQTTPVNNNPSPEIPSLGTSPRPNPAPKPSPSQTPNQTLNGTNFRIETLDDYTQAPIPEAEVTLQENEEKLYTTYTDQNGIAFFNYLVTNTPKITETQIGITYPNPATDYTKTNITTNQEEIKITLHNILGQQLITEQTRITPGNYEITTNLGNIAPGTYILNIETPTNRETTKIIKTTTNTNNNPDIQIKELYQHQQEIPTTMSLNKNNDEQPYSITTKRHDYDETKTHFYPQPDIYLTEYLSRNNQLIIQAQNPEGQSKSLELLINQETNTTPLTKTLKSGHHEIRGTKEHIMPLILEIASRDTTLTLRETQTQLIYPNGEPIPNINTTINGENITTNNEGKIKTHITNPEETYQLKINNPQIQELDTLIQLTNQQITLQEKIELLTQNFYLDQAEQPTITINLNEILRFHTEKDTAWITTNKATIINGNTIQPTTNNYNQEIPITIHAKAQHGTTKEFQATLHTQPLSPRTTIQLIEHETRTITPGYIILQGDTIPTTTGHITIHTQGLETIQTGLNHPTKKNLKWSYIRTTQLQQNKDTIQTFHIDFYLRNMQGEQTDSLNLEGLHRLPDPNPYYADIGVVIPQEQKMSPERYRALVKYLHFEGKRGIINSDEPPLNNLNNALYKWGTSLNEISPDTLVIYQKVKNQPYRQNGEIIYYYDSTMEEKTLNTIIQEITNSQPITGNIPIKIKDEITMTPYEQPPEILNNTIIMPDNKLHEWTNGWTGSVTMLSDNQANLKYCFINLQTNPEMSNMIGTVNHELYSAIIWHSQQRTSNQTHPLAIATETIMDLAGAPITPTLYDIKFGKMMYATTTNPETNKQESIFKQGEPIENIFLVPREYEYNPLKDPNTTTKTLQTKTINTTTNNNTITTTNNEELKITYSGN